MTLVCVELSRKLRALISQPTWTRNQYVKCAVSKENVVVKDDQGNVVPSQISRDNSQKYVTFISKDVPSMGFRTFEISEGKYIKPQNGDFTASDNSVENSYYKAVLGNGGIVSLYDKELKKELVHTSKFA